MKSRYLVNWGVKMTPLLEKKKKQMNEMKMEKVRCRQVQNMQPLEQCDTSLTVSKTYFQKIVEIVHLT